MERKSNMNGAGINNVRSYDKSDVHSYAQQIHIS